MDEQKEQLKKLIREETLKVVAEYNKSQAFTDRKLTDTPSDSLQVTPRKYVTMNGPSANRPTASVIGQFYLDTTIGKPIWWLGDRFIDGSGSTA